MKVIYFIRHSKPGNCSFMFRNSNIQIKNEKRHLTKEGRKLAKKFFSDKEFDCIEEIYSSNYLRAYQIIF